MERRVYGIYGTYRYKSCLVYGHAAKSTAARLIAGPSLEMPCGLCGEQAEPIGWVKAREKAANPLHLGKPTLKVL